MKCEEANNPPTGRPIGTKTRLVSVFDTTSLGLSRLFQAIIMKTHVMENRVMQALAGLVRCNSKKNKKIDWKEIVNPKTQNTVVYTIGRQYTKSSNFEFNLTSQALTENS